MSDRVRLLPSNIREPLSGKWRPFECMGHDQVVQERSVLFPYLILFIDDTLFDRLVKRIWKYTKSQPINTQVMGIFFRNSRAYSPPSLSPIVVTGGFLLCYVRTQHTHAPCSPINVFVATRPGTTKTSSTTLNAQPQTRERTKRSGTS